MSSESPHYVQTFIYSIASTYELKFIKILFKQYIVFLDMFLWGC